LVRLPLEEAQEADRDPGVPCSGMEDLPNYLLSASFGFPKGKLVKINIRESGEPESTALLNEMPLERFREILVKYSSGLLSWWTNRLPKWKTAMGIRALWR
jgi:hypothetical protein